MNNITAPGPVHNNEIKSWSVLSDFKGFALEELHSWREDLFWSIEEQDKNKALSKTLLYFYWKIYIEIYMFSNTFSCMRFFHQQASQKYLFSDVYRAIDTIPISVISLRVTQAQKS